MQLNLVNFTAEGDTSNIISNGEWDVIAMPIRRYEVFYMCCTAPYPKIKFWLVIRR